MHMNDVGIPTFFQSFFSDVIDGLYCVLLSPYRYTHKSISVGKIKRFVAGFSVWFYYPVIPKPTPGVDLYVLKYIWAIVPYFDQHPIHSSIFFTGNQQDRDAKHKKQFDHNHRSYYFDTPTNVYSSANVQYFSQTSSKSLRSNKFFPLRPFKAMAKVVVQCVRSNEYISVGFAILPDQSPRSALHPRKIFPAFGQHLPRRI